MHKIAKKRPQPAIQPASRGILDGTNQRSAGNYSRLKIYVSERGPLKVYLTIKKFQMAG